MSAEELTSVLKHNAHYESALESDHVQWLFDANTQEAAQPVLAWLCDNVSEAKNFLALEEIAAYEALEKEGKVLSGQGLQEALNALGDGDEDDDIPLHILEAELEMEEEKLERAKDRLRTMQAQRSMLTSMIARPASTASAPATSVRSGELAGDGSAQEARNRGLFQYHEQVDAMLVLISTMQSICRIDTNERASRDTIAEEAVREYAEVEREVSAHIQQLAESVLARQPTQSQSTPKASESPSATPLQSMLQNDTVPRMHDECQRELQRLQHSYTRNKEHEVEARMRHTRARAVLAALEEEQAKGVHYSRTDSSTIQSRRVKVEKEVATLRQRIAQIQDTHMAKTLRAMKEVVVAVVVEQDYEAKKGRQMEYCAAQDKILEAIFSQSSRQTWLLYALDQERDVLQMIHLLLEALIQFSKDAVDEHKQRMQEYDSRAAMHRQHEGYTEEVLRKACSEDVGIDASSLPAQMAALQNRSKEVDRSANAELGSQHFRLEAVQENATSMLALLDSCVEGSNLSSPEVTSNHEALENALTDLSHEMQSILAEYKEKSDTLARSSPEAKDERKLFAWYFTQPESIQPLLQKLRSRIAQ
eukprot:TRINITY_DN6135_c4_g1_i1.p1 TRINITY_DN6135_c4_g1~~TRINITY_DN6135_c4_g1_i1.p1  ORF type:complete len:592 (+),score=174.60 TRINITY_DN6135_c4_g1_i1:145-1920(+)